MTTVASGNGKYLTRQIMKTAKKIFRLICLFLLIVLASFGIGIAGGVPVTPLQRRQENPEITIELVESREDKEELTQVKTKE
jgi:hypothetical protein